MSKQNEKEINIDMEKVKEYLDKVFEDFNEALGRVIDMEIYIDEIRKMLESYYGGKSVVVLDVDRVMDKLARIVRIFEDVFNNIVDIEIDYIDPLRKKLGIPLKK